MDHKLLAAILLWVDPGPLPLWVGLAKATFVIVGCLFFAWLTLYRRDWIIRNFRPFGLRLGPMGVRLLACMFLFGVADGIFQLAKMMMRDVL